MLWRWLSSPSCICRAAVMTATELDLATKATFLFFWALLNFVWLGLLRRPAIAALLSLAMVITLIVLSQFKYDKLMMTVNFVDLMIIDPDTSAFLFTIMPRLRGPILLGVVIAVPTLVLLWRVDPFPACACARARSAARYAWAAWWRFQWPIQRTSTVSFSAATYVSKSPARAWRRFTNLQRTGRQNPMRLSPSALKRRRPRAAPARNFHTSSCCTMNRVSTSRPRPASKCHPVINTAFPVARWQSTETGGRRRGWPQLVHGIQCADWPFGALLWPLRDLCDAYCRRSRRPWSAERTRRCGYKTFSLYPFYGAFWLTKFYTMARVTST